MRAKREKIDAVQYKVPRERVRAIKEYLKVMAIIGIVVLAIVGQMK